MWNIEGKDGWNDGVIVNVWRSGRGKRTRVEGCPGAEVNGPPTFFFVH